MNKPKVPILNLVKLNPDETLNHSNPLPGYNFDEIFVIVGEFPGNNGAGNYHYLLYRYRANGSNKIGMMPGMIELFRFIPIDIDNDL